MKVISVAFIGIPVTDINRAREFYEGVLGLKLTEEMGKGHWIEYAIGGAGPDPERLSRSPDRAQAQAVSADEPTSGEVSAIMGRSRSA